MGPTERLALSWGNARQFTKLLLSLLSHIGKMVGRHGAAPCSAGLRAAASLQCLQPGEDANAKAELNHRSQACEVLTGTGVRVAKMVGHQGSAPCIPVWKTGVCLSTPMPVRNGIPCWNCTSLCGFANRRLNYSANGI